MHKITKLKNGLRLITAQMQGTKTATVLVVVGTGSKYESKKEMGISHFLEHLFFKGTKKRPTTLSISSELDSIGAEFNAFTSKEYTGYWVKADAGKIELAFDVVSDMLLNSKFDPREIEREKGVIQEEINLKLDSPMYYTEDLFEQCLYGDTPAGRDIIGTRKTVASFKRQDFIKYLNNQYTVNNTFVVLTGNIKNGQTVTRLANKYFSSQKFSKRGDNFQEKEAVAEAQAKPELLLHYRKTDQAHLAIGVRTFDYIHKNKATLRSMATILGGSMSSRLFINLRERQGLAYYVQTQAEHYSDSGYLMTRAGVPVSKVEIAIKTIISEYKKLKKTLVSASELKRTKDMLEGRLAIQSESSENVADWYAQQAVMQNMVRRTRQKYKAKIETPEEYLKLMKQVSAQRIKKLAQEIFINNSLNLAIIGPYKDKKKLEKLLKL